MVGEIKIENVHKEFVNPDGSKIVALNDVNLTVKPGSFIFTDWTFRLWKTNYSACYSRT